MASSRGQRSGPSSRPAPLHLLLIAVGLLFAQVPSLLHLLLVPHTTCEHGELVETMGGPEGPPQPPLILRGERERARTSVIGGARRDGHDHCDALAVRHRVPEVGVSVAAASLVWLTPAAEHGDRGETRPVPLLSLAPKSSPPAA